MRVRVDDLADAIVVLAIRPVLALPLLVLPDAARALEHLLRDLCGEEAHAIGFEIERAFERGDRDILEEIRAIGVGRAVAIVRAEVVHRLAKAVRIVLAAVEEEVLEQMREARLPALLVARADVIPEIDRDDRHAVVLVHEQREPVVEHELLMLYLKLTAVEGGLRLRSSERREGKRQREKGREFHARHCRAGTLDCGDNVTAFSQRFLVPQLFEAAHVWKVLLSVSGGAFHLDQFVHAGKCSRDTEQLAFQSPIPDLVPGDAWDATVNVDAHETTEGQY